MIWWQKVHYLCSRYYLFRFRLWPYMIRSWWHRANDEHMDGRRLREVLKDAFKRAGITDLDP